MSPWKFNKNLLFLRNATACTNRPKVSVMIGTKFDLEVLKIRLHLGDMKFFIQIREVKSFLILRQNLTKFSVMIFNNIARNICSEISREVPTCR